MAPKESYGYQWEKFVGSEAALKWNRRDLQTIDAAMLHVLGRTACVQAGGNLGIFPLHLAQYFKTVYIFEPDQECFAALCQNAPHKRIVKMQLALGEAPGLIALTRERREDKRKGVVHEGLGYVTGPGVLPMARLDDVLGALPVCDLLLLDLEGWELPALRGARALITRTRPVMMIEVNPSAERAGFSQDAVRQEIVSHGYRCVWRKQSDELYLPEAA